MPCSMRVRISSRMACISARSAGVAFWHAQATARHSSTRRRVYTSSRSSRDNRATNARPLGRLITSPSCSSRVNASRIGPRLTPMDSASCFSRSDSSGANCPLNIAPRRRSTTSSERVLRAGGDRISDRCSTATRKPLTGRKGVLARLALEWNAALPGAGGSLHNPQIVNRRLLTIFPSWGILADVLRRVKFGFLLSDKRTNGKMAVSCSPIYPERAIPAARRRR
jgi:hypothetical protein